MKRRILFILMACMCAMAFARVQVIPDENDSISQWFQISYGRSTERGFERNQNFYDIAYNFQYNPFEAFFGIQMTDNVTDMTLDTDWWFLSFHEGHIRIGLDFGYHAQWYTNISCEHDILLSPQISFCTKSNFRAKILCGFCEKITDVYLLKKNIFDLNPVLVFSLGKLFSNGLEFSIDAGTHTPYRHPVFGSAIFDFGVAYNFNRFRVGIDTEITMRDWIAASYYMDSVVVRFTGRVLF